MTVSLIIPAGFTDERRDDIFVWVRNRWEVLFPDWQVCIGEDTSDEYNRSRARNDAYEQSTGDLLVISDADTATDPENVLRALDRVEKEGVWVIAHKFYYSLTERYTDRLLEQWPENPIQATRMDTDWTMENRSTAGVLVMPREAYASVGGYDERFQGWGYEDNAFAERLTQVWGRPERTDGTIFHLWHPRGLDFDQPNIKHNEQLLEEIRRYGSTV